MKFKDYMHQGFIYGDAEQRGMRVCAVSPVSGRPIYLPSGEKSDKKAILSDIF